MPARGIRPASCPNCGASASAHTGSYCHECGEPLVDEAALERAVDRAVMERLRTDRAYLNAEDAEQQAEREEQITREELRRLGGGA